MGNTPRSLLRQSSLSPEGSGGSDGNRVSGGGGAAAAAAVALARSSPGGGGLHHLLQQQQQQHYVTGHQTHTAAAVGISASGSGGGGGVQGHEDGFMLGSPNNSGAAEGRGSSRSAMESDTAGFESLRRAYVREGAQGRQWDLAMAAAGGVDGGEVLGQQQEQQQHQ